MYPRLFWQEETGMIIVVYAILVFLVLRFSVTLFNFLSNPKLGYYGKRFSDKVSVIVVLSDLKDTGEKLLTSIKTQDYQNIEVIIKSPSEKMNKAVPRATGSYLLFLDANTIINKGLINNLIYRVKVFDLDLLSVVPNRKFKGLFSMLTYPLSDFVLINLLPLRLVRLSKLQTFAATNTPCMFFATASYRRNNWYEVIYGQHSTDVEIAKHMKEQKFKTEILLGNKFVYVEDGKGFNDLALRILTIFGNNVLAVIIYLILVISGPIIVLANFEPVLLVLPLGLIFLTRIMISFLTAQNPFFNLLLHPLQMAMLGLLLLKGLWINILKAVKQEEQ